MLHTIGKLVEYLNMFANKTLERFLTFVGMQIAGHVTKWVSSQTHTRVFCGQSHVTASFFPNIYILPLIMHNCELNSKTNGSEWRIVDVEVRLSMKLSSIDAGQLLDG